MSQHEEEINAEIISLNFTVVPSNLIIALKNFKIKFFVQGFRETNYQCFQY